MFKLHSFPTPVIVFYTIIMFASGDDPVLKISPTGKAVEPGHEVTFDCTHYPTDSPGDATLEWYISTDTLPVSQLLQNETFVNSTFNTLINGTVPESRYSVNGGKLTIKNVTFSDANTLVCKSPDGKLSKEVLLKVYTMPSYYTVGMIIVGINMSLIALFIVCFIWQFLRDRRENRVTRRKEKLGHKELAKRMIAD